MPTYEFTCAGCGEHTEQVFSMSEMPDSVGCGCGQRAERRISSNDNVFVKNREYVFDRSKNVRSFAADKGISDRKHHEHYVRYFDQIRQNKRAVKASKHKHGMEWIGGMPGEMVDSIGRNEGDPEAVIKDPVAFLKKTGTYAGD